MSQRESGYERKERDLYETPEWVTEALLPHLPKRITHVWEPACGSGKMVEVFMANGLIVSASDIDSDWLKATVPGQCAWRPFKEDFLMERDTSGHLYCVHQGRGNQGAIITNPPYELATEFCEHALRLTEADQGLVAMLLRTDFDHAKSRTHLFRDCPAFAKKVVLMKRIAWFVEANGKPKASPSFNHAWYIWDWQHEGPPTIGYGP